MSWINRIFLKGLFTLLPALITFALLVWLINTVEVAIGGAVRRVLPPDLRFPGLGIALILLLIFVTGLLVNHYMIAPYVRWLETTFKRVPFIKAIYNPLRDVMNLFEGGEERMKRVVLVTFPDSGLSLLGLVTRETFSELPSVAIPPDSYAVFIPYSFALGGFTVIVRRSQVREVDISVDKAMQLAITGWIKVEQR